MQRCAACGAEWFMVHNCPKAIAPLPLAIDPHQRFRDMVTETTALRALVREQRKQIKTLENTVTDLMLELAEVRSPGYCRHGELISDKDPCP